MPLVQGGVAPVLATALTATVSAGFACANNSGELNSTDAAIAQPKASAEAPGQLKVVLMRASKMPCHEACVNGNSAQPTTGAG
jgi:hypothetical protein